MCTFPALAGSSHAPNRLASYIDIHNSVSSQLIASRFVCFDETRFERVGNSPIYTLSGRIGCCGGLIVGVEKLLEVTGYLDGSPLVQTFRYAYNVSIQGRWTILRFDNAHAHDGHADAHHRHDFNVRTGKEIAGSPMWIGEAGWPTLGTLMFALRDWYYANSHLLPCPNDYANPEIGRE